MKWLFKIRLFSLNIGSYRFSPGLIMTLLTTAIAYTMYSLGVWQLSRGNYRDNLQQKIVARQELPALTFNELPYGSDERLYLPVRFRGRYDSSRLIYLDNRIVNGVVGYDVYTPFELANGVNVLVNRGFTAQGRTRQQLPLVDTPTGEVEIHGILEKQPPRGVMLGENLHKETSWPLLLQYIELAEIENKTGTDMMEMVVRLNRNEAGGLIYNQPVMNLDSSKNYGYAFQWFAMMTAVISLFLVMNTKKRISNDE